jgi:hypothetical protein
MTIGRVLLLPLAFVSVIAAGCGSSTPTPTAPAVTTEVSAGSGDATGGALEVRGTIGRVSGSCPVLRFTVGSVTVDTSRATTFTGGTCANVVSGAGVVVTGARQSAGTLAASSVAVRAATTR